MITLLLLIVMHAPSSEIIEILNILEPNFIILTANVFAGETPCPFKRSKPNTFLYFNVSLKNIFRNNKAIFAIFLFHEVNLSIMFLKLV